MGGANNTWARTGRGERAPSETVSSWPFRACRSAARNGNSRTVRDLPVASRLFGRPRRLRADARILPFPNLSHSQASSAGGTCSRRRRRRTPRRNRLECPRSVCSGPPRAPPAGRPRPSPRRTCAPRTSPRCSARRPALRPRPPRRRARLPPRTPRRDACLSRLPARRRTRRSRRRTRARRPPRGRRLLAVRFPRRARRAGRTRNPRLARGPSAAMRRRAFRKPRGCFHQTLPESFPSLRADRPPPRFRTRRTGSANAEAPGASVRAEPEEKTPEAPARRRRRRRASPAGGGESVRGGGQGGGANIRPPRRGGDVDEAGGEKRSAARHRAHLAARRARAKKSRAALARSRAGQPGQHVLSGGHRAAAVRPRRVRRGRRRASRRLFERFERERETRFTRFRRRRRRRTRRRSLFRRRGGRDARLGSQTQGPRGAFRRREDARLRDGGVSTGAAEAGDAAPAFAVRRVRAARRARVFVRRARCLGGGGGCRRTFTKRLRRANRREWPRSRVGPSAPHALSDAPRVHGRVGGDADVRDVRGRVDARGIVPPPVARNSSL